MCFLATRPALRDSCQSTYKSSRTATRASTRAATAMFAEPTNTRQVMRASNTAAMASAIAAARSAALMATASAEMSEASQRMMPMFPCAMMATQFARSVASSLNAAADKAEPFLEETKHNDDDDSNDDWQMKLAKALSLGMDAAADHPSRPADNNTNNNLPAAASADPSSPTIEPTTTLEPLMAEPAKPDEPEPIGSDEAEATPEPSVRPQQDDAVAEAKIISTDEPSDDDNASDDGVLVDGKVAEEEEQEQEEPVWLKEAGVRINSFDESANMDVQLDDLEEMGFASRELNTRVLLKNNGNLKRTIRALVEAKRADRELAD